MTMIHIAICSNDSSYIAEISSLLQSILSQELIMIHTDIFSGGLELEQKFQTGSDYQLIFLDIDTETCSISTARNLRNLGVDSLIICSSHSDVYFRELFEVGIFRFLDKPLNPALFRKYFLDAVEKIHKEGKYFLFKRGRQMHLIRIRDILYFESNRRKIILHKIDGKSLDFYGKLNDVERDILKLKAPFLRTHQSFLVNCNYVFGWKSSKLHLDGGIQIPVSEEQKKKIRSQFTHVLRKDT